MDVGKINRWVWVFCVVWMSILAGCATTRPGAGAAGSTGAAPQVAGREDGPTVERHLRARFAETFDGCKLASGALWPTFLCSGILMRGTGDYGKFRPWNPRPGSVVAEWPQEQANLPLEAFYYIANPGNCATGRCPPVDAGRTMARKDHRSLIDATDDGFPSFAFLWPHRSMRRRPSIT